MMSAVIRFSSWVEDGDVIIKFRTLQCYEDVLIKLIEATEFRLAPNSLTILEGWRDKSWLYVVVSIEGYEKEYIEQILRDVAWARNVNLIKVIQAEVEV